MSVSLLQLPEELWVHVEITPECGPVKYEYDPKIGLVVDRIMSMPMHYPLPYGYAPNTLCDDGDALDVLVMLPTSIMPGSWIKTRPIAVLIMEDEKGFDEKVLAVPTKDISSYYDHLKDLGDVPDVLLASIKAFFSRYKDLDVNKWSKVLEWRGFDSAIDVITKSMVKYQSRI